MIKYMKPNIKIEKLAANKNLTSLNTWLSENGLTDAGITTYIVNS